MPIYEYQCKSCEHITEVLRPMGRADESLVCESCGSGKTHRRNSEFAAGASKGGRGDMPQAGGCGRCGDPNGPCGM
jgi:putative FmdB family regulatory protein